ncbi:IucA/IucC family protein [Haloechinothrix halophila]|uniref:IucA/IucC family protein n=1 Tax=Haloechinothrix halophila TaxID=1069073 RepID=UPI000553A24D|nr:IucA/IucC family protein [Haloechinothrix halophila]
MTTEMIQRALRASSFVAARRRIFGQLLESLVYEDALTYRVTDRVESGVDTTEPGEDVVAAVVDATDADGEPVRYLFRLRRRFGFNRVALTADPVRRHGANGAAEADSITRFLAEVADALRAESDCLARFADELERTLLNDTLARYIASERGDVLADADYDQLESIVLDGHRYHPAFKSRVGFDVADNLAYGPEFAVEVRPLWLAAHRSVTEVTSIPSLCEEGFLATQLGQARASFQDTLRANGLPPAEYTMLPVHPWQWREHLATAFAEQLRRQQLIVLGEDTHTFRAQQSIRTLACRDVPGRPYLKLSLSLVNTSTSRVLAPHTVRNAPPISDWLSRLVDGDAFLRDELQLIILREVMGTAVTPEPPAEFARPATYGTLACIWRESLHGFLSSGECAVPVTALTASERDGTPFVDAWLREHGAREWTRRLVDVAVVPLLHLLVRHGVACEAHAQNMVLVHRDGLPERIALKDFHDGVRFSRAVLSDPDECPMLSSPPSHHVNANSFVETDDVELVTDFLLDAFCFINFGELAGFLDDAGLLGEREFWAIVRGGIADYQARFPELAERFALFDVAKPMVAVEKLTTRRLLTDTEPRLHHVPNPLAPDRSDHD